MPKVFVVQPIPEVALEVLREVAEVTVYPYVDRQIEVDELVAAARRHDYLFVMHETIVPAEVFQANPNLKGIGVMGGETGFVDFAAAKAAGVPVVAADPDDTLVPGGTQQMTADLTAAMILGLAYRLVEADRYTREGRFKQEQTISLLGIGCYRKTVGLIGLGGLARFLVPRLQAFQMVVRYTKRNRLEAAEEIALRVEWVEDLDEILASSDFVVTACDYNPSTHHLIGARELAVMKPTAFLVNTGRAWVVEEAALIKALQDGTIAGAGLDVFWNEPPATHDVEAPSVLFKMDNVILTPHNGGGTWDHRGSRTRSVAKGIAALIKGEQPAVLVQSTVNRALSGDPKYSFVGRF